MKIYFFLMGIVAFLTLDAWSAVNTYWEQKDITAKVNFFNIQNDRYQQGILSSLDEEECKELFTHLDRAGKQKLLANLNFSVKLLKAIANDGQEQLFLEMLSLISEEELAKVCIEPSKAEYKRLYEKINPWLRDAHQDKKKQILFLNNKLATISRDDEKGLVKLFHDSSLEDKKLILHLNLSPDSLYKKLNLDEDKKNFLLVADEKTLKEMFESLGPQSKVEFLSFLPAEKQPFFAKEIRRSQYIKSRFPFNNFRDPYSVNFMWIYKKPEIKGLIFPETVDNGKVNVIKNILEWANINDHINIWYDSKLVTPEMVEKTQEAFVQAGAINITLKDIRDLEIVKEHRAIFSAFLVGEDSTYLPVYYRVDFGRAIAGYETTKGGEIFVYADFDMKPTSKEKLFDPETLYRLKNFGMVMSHGGAQGYENGFQIISKKKPNLLEAMKKALIDPNIERATYAIKTGKYDKKTGYNEIKFKGFTNLQQIVYTDYINMFKLFHSLEGHGDLVHSSFFSSSPYSISREEHKDTFLEQHSLHLKNKPAHLPAHPNPIPTKEVELPAAGLQYND